MDAMEKNSGNLPLRRSIIAGLIGVVAALLLLFLCALGTGKQWLPQGREAVFGRIVLVLAGFCAGFLSCRKQSEGKAACAAISGAVLLVFVLLLGIITQRSSLINMSLLFNFLCIIFGGFAGCLLTAKRRKRRKRR